MTDRRSGGRLLADQILIQGTDVCFCVPGESYLPLLDGLHAHQERVRVITCRHEAAAANAAEAYGKLTGGPGVCMVTRGPGATQASVGVHTARQDSTPMVLLVGQVARAHRGREAFQEIDCEAVFGTLAKAVFELDDPGRIPQIVAAAFTLATSGRPGPVVISMPEDVLAQGTCAADAPRHVARQPAADPAAVRRLAELLAAARRPLVLAGGGPWDEDACAQLRAWAEAAELPVAASFRRQDVLDNDSACYVGDVGLGVNPRLADRIRECDLLLALGPRLTEIETQGYTLPAPPVAPQSLVHVHPDPGEIGRVYQPALGIVAGVAPFVRACHEHLAVDGRRWRDWTSAARRAYEDWSRPAEPPAGDRVDLREVMLALCDRLPPDTIYCNGAGNYTVWMHRFLRHRRWGTQLAPQSGAMGYGIPAALAAALVHPDRVAVAVAGDGCFQMAAQELATIAAERLPILVLVVNNGMLGTIRMHQERRFPGRVIATDLVNPDFPALARAYGLHAERVPTNEAFGPALERALRADGPALLELATDPEALTPVAGLSQTRARALAAG